MLIIVYPSVEGFLNGQLAIGQQFSKPFRLVLNTPGLQDKIFTLDVNGRRVIERNDVMYRDKLVDNTGNDGSDRHHWQDALSRPSLGKGHTSTNLKPLKPTPSTKNGGGLLGPILGGLLQRRQV